MNKATTDLNKDFNIIREETFKLYTFSAEKLLTVKFTTEKLLTVKFTAEKLLTVKFPAGYFRLNKQLKRKYFK